MDMQKPHTLAAMILAVSFIVSAAILGLGMSSRNDNNSITSTGSAKMRVTADSAKLTGDITRRVDTSNLKAGYTAANNDLAAVKKFLTEQGVSETEYEIGSLISSDVYNNGGVDYTKQDLRQTVTIDSSDVVKVKKVADNATSLIQNGVKFQTYNVEYFYSKLAEARVSLLGEAIKDAKSRATEIAKSAGNRVGALKNASSGVVQVLAPNSVSVEDYGNYDTSTLDKDIMVTVRATFKVN